MRRAYCVWLLQRKGLFFSVDIDKLVCYTKDVDKGYRLDTPFRFWHRLIGFI